MLFPPLLMLASCVLGSVVGEQLKVLGDLTLYYTVGVVDLKFIFFACGLKN